MSKDQKIIKVKMGLLELAKQLGNVSEACKVMGYSRDSFSASRSCTRRAGSRHAAGAREAAAGAEESSGAGGRGGRGALAEPTWGQVRVANELAKRALTNLAGGRPLRVGAARSADDQAAAEGAGGEGGAGGAHPDRGAGGGTGVGEGGQGSARGVRELARACSPG